MRECKSGKVKLFMCAESNDAYHAHSILSARCRSFSNVVVMYDVVW